MIAVSRCCFPMGETTGRHNSRPYIGAYNVGGRVPPNHLGKNFVALMKFSVICSTQVLGRERKYFPPAQNIS